MIIQATRDTNAISIHTEEFTDVNNRSHPVVVGGCE